MAQYFQLGESHSKVYAPIFTDVEETLIDESAVKDGEINTASALTASASITGLDSVMFTNSSPQWVLWLASYFTVL